MKILLLVVGMIQEDPGAWLERLDKENPGVGKRLAQGEWVEVFLEEVERGTLKAADLEKVALRALEEAKAKGKIEEVLDGIRKREVKAAIPQVVKRLKDEDKYVRQAAARAFGGLGAKEAVPELLKLLKDEEWVVCRDAAEALGELGAKEAVAELVKLLKDEVWYVRSHVAEWLARLGHPAGVEFLLHEGTEGLKTLNTLRQPIVLERLKKVVLTTDVSGSVSEVLREIAKASGFKIEFPEEKAQRWIRVKEGSTWFAALEAATPRKCSMILEEKEIRFVPWDEARTFWKAWWEEQKKR